MSDDECVDGGGDARAQISEPATGKVDNVGEGSRRRCVGKRVVAVGNNGVRIKKPDLAIHNDVV